MAQVSRPLLIAMAATVALMVVWVVALRPQPVAVENTPLAPTQVIPQAREASAISDAANAKVQAAAGNAPAPAATQSAAGPAGTPPATTPPAAQAPATGKAATPAKAAAPAKAAGSSIGERRDAALMRQVARGKVVVLLFWNPTAADDVATRGALRDLDLRDGKVVVRVVPISKVAQYTSVTQGVKIAQSPTTVIIGRKGDARVITGLTEPRELAQAVGDAVAGR